MDFRNVMSGQIKYRTSMTFELQIKNESRFRISLSHLGHTTEHIYTKQFCIVSNLIGVLYFVLTLVTKPKIYTWDQWNKDVSSGGVVEWIKGGKALGHGPAPSRCSVNVRCCGRVACTSWTDSFPPACSSWGAHPSIPKAWGRSSHPERTQSNLCFE